MRHTVWPQVSLSGISSAVSYGYTASAKENPVGPKFLRITDIRNHFIDWPTVPYCEISASDYSKYRLEVGDICIARTGASTGDSVVIKQDTGAVFASYLVRFQADREKANPFFLGFVVKSDLFKRYVESIIGGSAQPNANAKQLGGFTFSLPPLPIQRRIADILGALDDKIEVNRRINRTLEAMAQALYKHWFVDFGPFQDGEFVESELGLIPEGWKVEPLSSLVELLSGGTPKTSVKEYWGGNINWIAAGDVIAAAPFIMATERTITPLGVENSSSKILPAFTTIITARGTVGQCGLLSREMAMNQTNYGIRGTGGLRDFTTYLLIQNTIQSLRRHAYGTVFDTITRKTFEAIPVLTPPDSAWSDFESMIHPWFLKMLSNQQEIVKLGASRDYLLPRLLSGEIPVRGVEETIADV